MRRRSSPRPSQATSSSSLAPSRELLFLLLLGARVSLGFSIGEGPPPPVVYQRRPTLPGREGSSDIGN